MNSRMLKKTKMNMYDFSILVYFCALLSHVTYIYTDTIIFKISAIFVLVTTITHIKSIDCLKKSKYIAWYLYFCVFALLSMLWAIDDSKVFALFAIPIPIILFSAFIINLYIVSEVRVYKALNFLIIAGVYSAIRCLLNTNFSTFHAYYNRGMFASKLLVKGLSYNSFTTPLALIAIISIFMSYYEHKKIYYVVYIFILGTLIISGSRKTIVVAVLGLVLVSLLYKRNEKLYKKLIAISVILITVYCLLRFVPILYSSVGHIMEEMFMSVFTSTERVTDFSLIERAFYRQKAWEVFLQNPILGAGIDNFSSYLEAINYSHAVYAHNNFLELLADGGIIGFLVYYWFYIKILFISFRLYLKHSKIKFHILVLSFMVCLLIMEYGQIIYFNIYAQLVMAVVLISFERIIGKYRSER